MQENEITNELYQIREAYAKQHNYNLKSMWVDLRKKQAQSGRVVVSFPPKRIDPSTVQPITKSKPSENYER